MGSRAVAPGAPRGARPAVSPSPWPPRDPAGHRVDRPGAELTYGASRTQLWLRRVHDVRVAMGTIQRSVRDPGLPRLRRTRKRVPRQMKLFEKAEPGESVQVDVKFVKITGRWAFRYTALDDCTRFRVLRLYPRLHQRSSLAFLVELQRALPLPDPQAAVRQRPRVSARFRPCGRSGRHPASLHSAAAAPAEREGGAQPSDRPGGVLGTPSVYRLRRGDHCPSSVGANVQLRTVLPRPAGAHASREARGCPPG